MNKKIVDHSAVKFGQFLLTKNSMFQSSGKCIYVKYRLHVTAQNVCHHQTFLHECIKEVYILMLTSFSSIYGWRICTFIV
jgi:hypothetical protein